MSAPTCHRGSTLIELLVTITLLSVMTAVATMAVRRIEKPDPTLPATIIEDSLRRVVAEGRPATVSVVIDGRAAVATINADGSIDADSAFHIDRLTGRTRRLARTHE